MGMELLPLDAASPTALLVVGVGLAALGTCIFGSALQNVPLRAAGQNFGSGYNTRVLGYDTARGEVRCWLLPLFVAVGFASMEVGLKLWRFGSNRIGRTTGTIIQRRGGLRPEPEPAVHEGEESEAHTMSNPLHVGIQRHMVNHRIITDI